MGLSLDCEKENKNCKAKLYNEVTVTEECAFKRIKQGCAFK